jgi:hypothetical protein
MPQIQCELAAFKTRTDGVRHVAVSRWELLKGAATVGMPTLASHPASRRPLTEMLWRIGMVAANIRPTSSKDRWTRTDAYNRLDPSEKSAVSYFLGMTQTAVMARKVLGYPHLVHVDLLLQQQGSKLTGTRPDFVAVNPNRFGAPAYSAVFEAKGRTNGFDQSALNRAKDQVRLTPGVRGLVPKERVASQAYFDDAHNWSSVLRDPDGEGAELDFGIETYLMVYYRNIIEAGLASNTWRDVNGNFEFSLPGYPITLRMPIQLVEAYHASALIEDTEVRDQEANILKAYRELASSPVPTPLDDLVQIDLRSGAEEAELLALFEPTVTEEPGRVDLDD